MRAHRVFIQLPQLARNISGGTALASIFLYLKLVYFVISRQSYKKDVPMTFTFTWNQTPFTLDLKNNLDIAVMVEVFGLMEYEWDVPTPTTILDLGAHWGDTALYYTTTYPDAAIFSIEPDPVTYKRLCDVTKSYSNITPIHAALNNTNDEVTLYQHESSLGNALVDRNDGTGQSVSVPGTTVNDIMSDTGVRIFDIVKFDIEGAESILLQYPDLRQLGRAFIGEIHLDLMSMTLDQVKQAFSEFSVELTNIGKDRYILKATSVKEM